MSGRTDLLRSLPKGGPSIKDVCILGEGYHRKSDVVYKVSRFHCENWFPRWTRGWSGVKMFKSFANVIYMKAP